jgi:Cyclin, N-terminal domain/Cyclin, C-terminal domain
MTAMNYVDRVLLRRNPLPTTKSEVQLIALTCFYLAVKLFQTGPILSTEQMGIMSGFTFTSKEIADMEKNILHELAWSLYPPLPTELVRPYFQIWLCRTNIPLEILDYDVIDLANKILHTASLDYFFVAFQFQPSHIAVAALLNALHTVLPTEKDIPTIHEATEVISQLTGYPFEDTQVFHCCQRLWELLETSSPHLYDTKASTFCVPKCIQSDYGYRAGSPTFNSPVGVASLTTVNCSGNTAYRFMK